MLWNINNDRRGQSRPAKKLESRDELVLVREVGSACRRQSDRVPCDVKMWWQEKRALEIWVAGRTPSSTVDLTRFDGSGQVASRRHNRLFACNATSHLGVKIGISPRPLDYTCLVPTALNPSKPRTWALCIQKVKRARVNDG